MKKEKTPPNKDDVEAMLRDLKIKMPGCASQTGLRRAGEAQTQQRTRHFYRGGTDCVARARLRSALSACICAPSTRASACARGALQKAAAARAAQPLALTRDSRHAPLRPAA